MKNKRAAKLLNKIVVILGGTSGIGLETAIAAAEEGAKLVVVSSSQQKVDNSLMSLPISSRGFAVDLTNEMQVIQFFDDIGKFDHLIFTAGDTLNFYNLLSIDIEQAQESINLRLWGAIIAVKYGAPLIREGGSITLTTGALGKRPRKGSAVISAMASAIEGLTRSLAIELEPLRVNAVCAGTVRTNLLSHLTEIEREAFFDDIGSNLLTRKVGNPRDLAEAYIYLMRCGFITGQIITVDGGSVLV